MAPKDKTLLKGDGSSAVYVVVKGQLRSLTAAEFKGKKYKIKDIRVLPQAEL